MKFMFYDMNYCFLKFVNGKMRLRRIHLEDFAFWLDGFQIIDL